MGKTYDPRLDGIRAFAALSVMLFHANILRGGSEGVDVFFVLSGFLITGLLVAEVERTGAIQAGPFLARRARRLLPALALLLAVYAVGGPWLWARFLPARWIDLGAASLAITNWREALSLSQGPLAHTWSLGVEWQFYFVWPAVIAGLLPFGKTRAALVLCLGWTLLTIGRELVLTAGHDALAYMATPLHATGLLLGAALALRQMVRGAFAGWAGLVALAALSFVPHTHDTFSWRLPLIELAAVPLVASPPAFMGRGPLPYLGKLSYGIYLWHVPVWHALWMTSPALRDWLFMPISILLAAASYHTVEALFRQRRASASVAARAIA